MGHATSWLQIIILYKEGDLHRMHCRCFHFSWLLYLTVHISHFYIAWLRDSSSSNTSTASKCIIVANTEIHKNSTNAPAEIDSCYNKLNRFSIPTVLIAELRHSSAAYRRAKTIQCFAIITFSHPAPRAQPR